MTRFSILLLAPALTGLLFSCGGSPAPGLAKAVSSTVSGEVLYPPAPGTVTLYSTPDNRHTAPLVQFRVGRSGAYSVALPVPAQLSQPGQTDALPLLPPLPGYSPGECAGAPLTSSDPALRLASVPAASFSLLAPASGQAPTLRLAARALAGPQGQTTSLWQQYVYADRSASLSARLTCTLDSASGPALPIRIGAEEHLRRGWNVLLIRTVQSANTPLQVLVSVSDSLGGVQWQYLPGS